MKVSPFIVEHHEFGGFLLVPLLLSDSVVCEEFEHKISTPIWVNPCVEAHWDQLM